jgi:hypothetical protein
VHLSTTIKKKTTKIKAGKNPKYKMKHKKVVCDIEI